MRRRGLRLDDVCDRHAAHPRILGGCGRAAGKRGESGSFTQPDGTQPLIVLPGSAAGITTGCGPSLYCPGSGVTREQMATFLARALHLPPGHRVGQGQPLFAKVDADKA